IDHFTRQLCHFTALERLKIAKLLAGNTILVVIIALVNDIFRSERIAHFLLKLLEDIRRNRSRISIPVYILFPLEFIKQQGELMEEGGVSDDIDVRVLFNKLAQALHGIRMGLGLAHIK